MQKITPFLWFNDQAEEAAEFYTSIFENAKTGTTARYDEAGAQVSGRPAGSVMTVAFTLCGQEFVVLNGGPAFTFTPAISFMVNCETEEQADALWKKLADGGSVMMEYQPYPFADKYGWLNDKYGVSWQLFFRKGDKQKQNIHPSLMFVGKRYGQAEEAIGFYTSVFPDSAIAFVQKRKEDTDTPPMIRKLHCSWCVEKGIFSV